MSGSRGCVLPIAMVVIALSGCSVETTEANLPASTIAASTSTVPEATTTTTTTVVAEPSWAVVVVGDFGTGSEVAFDVASALRGWVGRHPQTLAMVTTGDNFYDDDLAVWTGPYGWVDTAGIPVEPVAGNHDQESPQRRQTNVVAFGAYPSWRRVALGPLEWVLLDSNRVTDPQQRAWLEETVADLAGGPWVAVFHHPWWSCGEHGSTPAVDEQWGDLLGGAVLVLSGHDHTYQRFEGDAGWLVVTGGGGYALHEIGACPAGTPDPVFARSVHHFVAIWGGPAGIWVDAVDTSGTVIDRFPLRHP